MHFHPKLLFLACSRAQGKTQLQPGSWWMGTTSLSSTGLQGEKGDSIQSYEHEVSIALDNIKYRKKIQWFAFFFFFNIYRMIL